MAENYMWVFDPKTPAKISKHQKEALKQKVDGLIKSSNKLSKVTYRFDIRAGRVYIYHLVEQFGWDDPNAIFIKPLIDGRYNEFPLARIMLVDARGEKCRLDWQRHNGEWMPLYEDCLEACIRFIEEDDWFSHFFK